MVALQEGRAIYGHDLSAGGALRIELATRNPFEEGEGNPAVWTGGKSCVRHLYLLALSGCLSAFVRLLAAPHTDRGAFATVGGMLLETTGSTREILVHHHAALRAVLDRRVGSSMVHVVAGERW